MTSEAPDDTRRRLVSRLKAGGYLLAGTAFAWVIWAAFAPLHEEVDDGMRVAGRSVSPLPSTRPNLRPLLARVAGTPLIRPAQAVSAVKDDGTAARLVKRLKLQGITQLNGEMVAYVQVEKEGSKTVRRGDALLEFVVESVEEGRVTLSLRGVQVVLGHG